MKKLRTLFAIILAFAISLTTFACGEPPVGENILPEDVKNVILLIGDGMGPNQVKAGELYKGKQLAMQKIKQQTTVDTNSISGVTDSAAAATALATGTLTTNGRIGMDENQIALQTIVDIAKAHGKSAGVITTEELYGATPMGFSGHFFDRSYPVELLTSAAITSNIDLFVSYTMDKEYVDILTTNGYSKIENPDDISSATEDKIIGAYDIKAIFPSMTIEGNTVALDRLVSESLDFLSKDNDGLFLMVEGAHIDHGGHSNLTSYMLTELIAFDDAVKVAVDWASARKDTIVIVTADHETGGLTLLPNAEKIGAIQACKWTTSSHTPTNVNLYFYGPKIDFAKLSSFNDSSKIKNTDVFDLMSQFMN